MGVSTSRGWLHQIVVPVIVFLALAIGMTALSFVASALSARIGTFRPPSSIPSKLSELAAVGVALGVVSSIPTRRLDYGLIVLSVGFILLLDVDHLPSLFGVAEPIRPAHSFVFLALLVGVLALAVRGRPELELIAGSSFLGHIAIGSGVFPLLAPFSYAYYGVDGYAIPLLLASAALAAMAGFARRTHAIG